MTNNAETPHPAVLTPSQERRTAWLRAYTARTAVPLSVLALAYLVTYSIQSIWHDPGQPWFRAMWIFGNVLWVLFAVDLAIRFIVTPVKRHFFRHNWLSTLTVILPQFRALRALRAFSPNGLISERTGSLSRGGITSGLLAVVIVVWVGSLMVLNAERGAPKAEIDNIGDAVWWAFETITTVGYGDFVPVTWSGRFYAVFIMLIGISALGVVTASMSSYLVKRAHTASNPNADVLQQIAELKEMVATLQEKVGASNTVNPPQP
jgi:voltage-gated potassium channel